MTDQEIRESVSRLKQVRGRLWSLLVIEAVVAAWMMGSGWWAVSSRHPWLGGVLVVLGFVNAIQAQSTLHSIDAANNAIRMGALALGMSTNNGREDKEK